MAPLGDDSAKVIAISQLPHRGQISSGSQLLRQGHALAFPAGNAQTAPGAVVVKSRVHEACAAVRCLILGAIDREVGAARR